ncbi:hypothetical protein CF319_g8114 [Tilletia indica]|nr:hypothetical protein CF319_g8114 [Tilletia indica]
MSTSSRAPAPPPNPGEPGGPPVPPSTLAPAAAAASASKTPGKTPSTASADKASWLTKEEEKLLNILEETKNRVSEPCSEAVATGDFAFDPALGDSGAGEEDAQEGDEEKEWEDVDEDQDQDKKGKKSALSTTTAATTTARLAKRRSGSDQLDKMVEVLSELVAVDTTAPSSQPEDPVEIATRTLLEKDADDFEAEAVARLIGFFAANLGAARAYATLAGTA